jgi:hypothetical protein
MPKLGKPFELVVSDVVKEMDPNATVHQGEWVVGPDGERELDVIVEGTVDDGKRRIQIECRDYNPEGRPIGIAHIDALESKHRDLKMDVSFLCSNAGFSADAIRKAKRVGIGLIGVLRQDDPRIRYRVVDEIYIRRVDFVENSAEINFDFLDKLPPQGNLRCEEIKFDGQPVFDWLLHRLQLFVAANPIVKGMHSLKFRFKRPINLDLPFGVVRTSGVRIQFKLVGGWFAQRIEIDATSGLYSWIRRAILLGPGQTSVSYKDVKFGQGGVPIKCPPDFNPTKPVLLADGEVSMWILDLGGINVPQSFPRLDDFVFGEDLELLRRDVQDEAYYS